MSESEFDLEMFKLQTKILSTLRTLGGGGTSEMVKTLIGDSAIRNIGLWNRARNGLLEAGLIVQDTPQSKMYLI